MRTEHVGRASRGQALVETLVALVALLALLVGVIALGKLIDLRHAAIAAARGLAFECAVRPRECERSEQALLDEIRARHFLHDDGPVYSASPAGFLTNRPARRVPVWTDRAGRPVLERLEHVAVSTPSRRLDAPRARLDGSGPASPLPGSVLLDRAGPTRFGLATSGGLLAAQVRADASLVDLAARFDPFSAPGPRADPPAALPRPLPLSGRTAILVDGWAASGPDGGRDDTVRSRVAAGARLPGGGAAESAIDAGYAGTRLFMRVADTLGVEPVASQFRPRALGVDVVPSDRRP